MSTSPRAWAAKTGETWTPSGPALPTALPGLVAAPAAGPRRQGTLYRAAEGDTPGPLAAWRGLLDDGRALGLPLPARWATASCGDAEAVVTEAVAGSLAAQWAADPSLAQAASLVGGLAELAEALDRLPDGSATAPRIHLGALVCTARGRTVLGPGALVAAAPSSPEGVFGAQGGTARAGFAWSLGVTLFALLCTPPERLAQGRPGQSQRVRLIRDLHSSRPRLFAHRAIEAREFLYPEALPDQDRATLGAGIQALVGENTALAAVLTESAASLLDLALAIDPGRRDEGLAQVGRGLRRFEAQLQAASRAPVRSAPPAPSATAATATPPAAPLPRRGPGWGVVVLLGLLNLGSLGGGLLIGRATAPAAPAPVAPPPARSAPAALVGETSASAPEPAPTTAAAPPAPATEAAPTARRSSRSAPAPVEAAPALELGQVRIEGGRCRLVDEAGTEHGCGSLPVGRYVIWARPDGGSELALGSHLVRADRPLRIQCGFGTCRIR